VRESGEILDGKRTAYSTGPSSEGDDLAAAVRAAKLAANQETSAPPKTQPTPAKVVTRPSSSATRPTTATSTKKPPQVITVTNPNRSGPTTTSISPKAAAQALANYATQELKAGRGANLGVKGKPSRTVAEYQAAMGNITADGMYGPATRTRGQQLGVNMPVRK
jgi:hypothetical protein